MAGISNQTTGFQQRLQLQYQSNNDQVRKSVERLSTGKRINRPSDDPAKFMIAEGIRGDLIDLRAETRASQAERRGVHQKQSALTEIQNVLNHVRGNLVEAADGTLTSPQRESIQQEIDASLDAIDRIAGQVDGIADSSSLYALGEGGAANVVSGDVELAANIVDQKIQNISSYRASLAAYERAELDTFDRLREDLIAINTQSLSQIEDADYAAETSNLIQGQILSQASLAALTYSNREQLELVSEILDDLETIDQVQ